MRSRPRNEVMVSLQVTDSIPLNVSGHGACALVSREDSPDWQWSQGQSWPRILEKCQRVCLAAETTVFDVGSPCESFLFLESGSVRVQAHGPGERELLLYRVHPKESCVLTTSCLLAGETYPAEGVTESDITALLLPRSAFLEELDTSAEFRRLVFSSYAKRLCDVIQRLQQITMSRVASRLAGVLLRFNGSGKTNIVHITHQDLATEIGTSREVVSRELHRFQVSGWVEVGRGQIAIIDRASLEGMRRI